MHDLILGYLTTLIKGKVTIDWIDSGSPWLKHMQPFIAMYSDASIAHVDTGRPWSTEVNF